MSLKCTGQTFITSSNARPWCYDEGTRLARMQDIQVDTSDCSLEGAKVSFLKAMEEFANSPHFKWLVYQFDEEFEIKVRRTLNMSMP